MVLNNPLEIDIENQQKKLSLNLPEIKKIIKLILKHEKISDAILSFVFVTYQKIIIFNKKYMGRAYATDVLAFDNSDKPSRKKINADIIISTDAVIKNSKIFKTSLKHEFVLYLCHGVLHLLGYDDHKENDIKQMRKKEQELLIYIEKSADNVCRMSKTLKSQN